MTKVTFSHDFNWIWPEFNGRVSTWYKAGSTYTVKRNCADEAIAKGVAKEGAGASRKASTSKAVADGESTD